MIRVIIILPMLDVPSHRGWLCFVRLRPGAKLNHILAIAYHHRLQSDANQLPSVSSATSRFHPPCMPLHLQVRLVSHYYALLLVP